VDLQTTILALLRGLHLAALLSLFGTLISLALVAPVGLRDVGAAAAPVRRRLISLARWSGGLALLIGACWIVSQASVIAGATTIGGTLHTLVLVARDTQFGNLVLIRFALLLLALPLLGGRGWRMAVALLLTGAALAIEGGFGHAGAGATAGVNRDTLLALEALHLLAAGAWVGGLLPLFLLVGSLPPPMAADVCESFTPVGLSAVLTIASTALALAWQLIGSLAGLFHTDYGLIALAKLGLFLLLLILACVNRFALTERIRDPARPLTRRWLRMSVATEAMLGMLVIIVAAFLASAAPATH
jgi:putative copper resistance protein D